MNLVDFLKKYSSISNEFIDDFYGLYNEDTKYSFHIRLDIVAEWLGTIKGRLKETLVHSYKKNIDYKIIKDVNKGTHGGATKEDIFLTPKCFKLLSMQSKTKKANEVRLYYYELEELVDKYKNYIISGLKDKIEKIESNQKPKINPQKGVIYIIHAADDIGLQKLGKDENLKKNFKKYKIGKATNLSKRMSNYNSDKADDIIPLFVYETDDVDEIEKCVKAYAKKYQYRKYKEIYEADINMLKNIIKGCSTLNTQLKSYEKNTNRLQNGGNLFIAIYKE